MQAAPPYQYSLLKMSETRSLLDSAEAFQTHDEYEHDESIDTKEGIIEENPLDDIVSLSHTKSKEQIRIANVGYVDTNPEELGAVPMTGKNRHEWKKIQQVTFTNWVNDRVSGPKGKNRVTDLQKDLQNGVLLIDLLENLSKKKIPKVVRNPEFTAQKLDNLSMAFKFMLEEKVKLVGIGKMIALIHDYNNYNYSYCKFNT